MFIKFVSQTHQSCLAPGYCSASLKLSVPNSKAPRRFWEYQNITWSSIYTFCTSLSTPHLYSPNVAHTLKHAKIQSKFIVHAPSQGRKEKWKEKETEGVHCIKIWIGSNQGILIVSCKSLFVIFGLKPWFSTHKKRLTSKNVPPLTKVPMSVWAGSPLQ